MKWIEDALRRAETPNRRPNGAVGTPPCTIGGGRLFLRQQSLEVCGVCGDSFFQ